ncbi:MAG TPA: PDZ domain-containing protein [Puia sp.]
MRKQYLLKISGLAALTLLLLSPSFAQDTQQNEDKDSSLDKPGKLEKFDEIIIRRKNDKDTKVTIEMKDGQVWVNGKPVSEFEDSSITIRKKKIRIMKGNGFSFSEPGEIEDLADLKVLEAPDAPDAPLSPFRKHSGALNLEGANRAFLGVTSEKPEQEGTGAEVKEISKGSAAEKAGLRQGDLITKVDEITIIDPAGLSEAIHKYKPQDKITITYKRGGKEAKATAILGKSRQLTRVYNYNYHYDAPNLNMPEYDFKQLMPPGDLRSFSWGDEKPRLGIRAQDTEDGKGVKVLDVIDESAAEKAGIKEGDVITSFDGKEVNSAVTLAELARAGKDKPSIKVGLIREGKPREIEVKVPRKLKTANL